MGGRYFLNSRSAHPSKQCQILIKKGPLHTKCRVIHHVVESAAEAELGLLCQNGQTAIPLLTKLKELGHPEPLPPIETDNYSTIGIVNSTAKKKSKINGHEILLGQGYNMPMKLIHLLGLRQKKSDYFT